MDWKLRTTVILSRLLYLLAKHWLLMANTVIGAQVIVPILAPTFMATGYPSIAQLIYAFYRPLCHQLPERSFFLFGTQLTYTLAELERLAGPYVPPRYLGNNALGYKMAICQRDFIIYLTVLLAGLAFVLLRRHLRPLSLKVFALLCAPMALDGFGQLLMLWESTWYTRVLSGALFGVACVWLAYPYIELGMNDLLKTMEEG